ncbi:MAG: hypothetical protein IJO70_12215 [Lachnospiraceae bacterium]|nr:hypothetical protein [Lachnospiraceae bacterium]
MCDFNFLNNGTTVAPGTDVSFPNNGPNSGGGIARVGADSFNLAEIGTYQVFVEVGVDEAGCFFEQNCWDLK